MTHVSTIGQRLLELRTGRTPRFTQQGLAERAGVSVDLIQKLEQGRKQSARISTLTKIADALETDLAALVRTQPYPETAPTTSTRPADHHLRSIVSTPGSEQEVDTTNRRQVLASAVGLAGMTIVDPPGGLLADASGELLRTVAGSYRRLENTHPSRLLIRPVASCVQLVREIIRSNELAGGRLYAVLSEVAGLAAWLHVDLQNVPEARRYYLVAVEAAERSGHQLLPIYMKASLGQFAAEAGDASQGLNLMRSVRRRLPRHLPTIAHVWLDAVEARVLAERRDREALVLIRRSESRLPATAGDDPIWPWIFKFDHSKLAGYRAVCATRLGRTAEARASLAEAASHARAPKQHAALQVEHARTLWADGETEESCALAAAALDTAQALESERVHHMVRELRSSMGDSAGPVAADLDERLASAYGVDK